MTGPWMAAVAALAALGLTTATVLLGLIRRISPEQLPGAAAAGDAVAAARSPLGGLPAGTPVPWFIAETDTGRPVDERVLYGEPAVLLFVRAGCPPCERLIADLAGLERSPLPVPLLIVTDHPADAPSTSDQPYLPPGVALLLQRDGAVTDAFGVTDPPYATAVSADGMVRAGGRVGTVNDLLALAWPALGNPASGNGSPTRTRSTSRR